MSVIEVKSEDQFTELTTNAPKDKVFALYFFTPWAGPCVQLNSVYSQLAEQNPGTTFLSINADEHPEISELFDVSVVPYFLLVKDDVILKEASGADPKEFIAELNQLQSQSAEPAAQVQQPPQEQPQVVAQEADALQGTKADDEETPEALNARLKSLTEAAPVMLFMKGTPSAPQCGFSRQMVAILREHQVRFGFFDILKDDSVRQGLKVFSDWPTFPQLYINGELQGGLDIIKENLEEDPKFFETALKE